MKPTTYPEGKEPSVSSRVHKWKNKADDLWKLDVNGFAVVDIVSEAPQTVTWTGIN